MIAGFVMALALATAQQEAPAAEAQPSLLKALADAGLDPKTKLENGALQVMYGQRAVVRIDRQNQPILDEVEIGRIDRAVAAGDPKAFKGVGPGKLAFALDASAKERVSMMKVWNALTTPVAFETEIVALRGGQLMKKKIPACSVAAGAAAYETWPDPIIAVAVSALGQPHADTPACNNDEKE